MWRKSGRKIWINKRCDRSLVESSTKTRSTLPARWRLHTFRIYSYAPLYQATLGKSLAKYLMQTTSSRQNKISKCHELSYMYSRQKYQAGLARCLFMSDLGLDSDSRFTQQIPTDCTHIPSRNSVEFLWVIWIALDWVPYACMLKYELTFPEGSCTE